MTIDLGTLTDEYEKEISIHTTATGKDGEKSIVAGKEVTIIDTVPDYITDALDEFVSYYGSLEEVYEHKDEIYYYSFLKSQVTFALRPKVTYAGKAVKLEKKVFSEPVTAVRSVMYVPD